MKKALSLLMCYALGMAAFCLDAATADLLDGSIDFNDPVLWGKTIKYGLDDNGNYTGVTRWYLGVPTTDALILQHPDRASGYLHSSPDTEVHRTINRLTEETGPRPTEGVSPSVVGLFIDTEVALDSYTDADDHESGEKDKINFWIYTPEDEAVTNFIITAWDFESNAPTNYITDAKVVPGETFKLVVHALTNQFSEVESSEERMCFEVYVNGERVHCGERETFPSLLSGTKSDYGQQVYSLGLAGEAIAEKINFTRVNPIDDPTYDMEDTTMLREFAEITINGYPSSQESQINFPALIRISEETVSGFIYSRTAVSGSDIRFTDENGKVIPHEIDTWNTNGTSLVWVKIPLLRNGTKITMHWGIRGGSTAPSVNYRKVWSDYVAVWHFNEDGYAKDSTGNGFDARPDSATTAPLVNEFGQVIGTSGYLPPDPDLGELKGSVLAANYYEQFAQGGNFTFTGWYMARDYQNYVSSATKPLFGTKYETGTDITSGDSLGWCGLLASYQKFAFQPSGKTDNRYTTDAAPAPLTNNWFHVAFALTKNRWASLYFNGDVVEEDVSFTVKPTTRPFQVMRSGMCGDEIRIARKTRSAEWLRAEYEQTTNAAYFGFSPAEVKGTDNYWVVEPSVTPSSCEIAKVGELVVFEGKPRYLAGGLTTNFVNIATGEVFYEQPTAVGSYKFVVEVKESTEEPMRDGLHKEVPFVIYSERAYQKISGYDRIMLFNSDDTAESPVVLQGYYDKDESENSVWDHDGAAWKGKGYALPGTSHTYYEPGTGRALWTFRNSRIGNLFPNESELTEGMNFLPWGGNAKQVDDSTQPVGSQIHAGCLIFQNMEDPENDPAVAVSPYYANGVGTVYFDAVNSSCDYVNVLKLQVCEGEDEPEEKDAWKDVPADVFAIKDGQYDASMSTSATERIELKMSKDEGTTNWFYRIRAHLDHQTGCRIRIVRVDTDFNEGGEEDGDGLVLIDNIIVSYPAMGIEISQFGAPADPDNLAFRGQRSPFDIAFPSAADLGNVHPQAKVRYITNNTEQVDVASFVGSFTFNYRWRYLNQQIGEWNQLLLSADSSDPGRFVSSDAIEGEGMGDVEYNFTAVVNAPFYKYFDYSGLVGWAFPDGKSERRGDMYINAVKDGVYSEEKLSPAGGIDYFIRLREGSSDYEGMRLYVKRADDNSAALPTPIDMELLADHTWRGYYQTLTNVDAGVVYRIEACNLQDHEGGDYQWNTNWLSGSDQTSIPANDVVSVKDTWAKVPCDGVTGYLVFQLEDQTRSLAIIHADYQNFNKWTDARRSDGCFLGTSAELPTSGVSRVAQKFVKSFDSFNETLATNGTWWQEFFLEDASETGKWAIEQPFTGSRLTPNGWTAENGMWVCEKYRKLGEGNGISLQLNGSGYGSVLFPQNQNPRGVGVFSYTARAAQSYDIHSYNYYTGTGSGIDVYNLTNYTFAIPCSMTTDKDGSFVGLGAISAVAYYRDSKGGYEARIERTDDNRFNICLYKWYSDGSSELLGRAAISSYEYKKCGLGGLSGRFATMFVSCQNTSSNTVQIIAGLANNSRVIYNSRLLDGNTSYWKVCYEDAVDPYLSGTYGVGSKDCPASFIRPIYSPDPVEWSTNEWKDVGQTSFHYWTTAKPVSVTTEEAMITNVAGFEAWNYYRERLDANVYTNNLTAYYGFKAQVPKQFLVIETSPHLENDWSDAVTNYLNSFDADGYTNYLHIAVDSDVRLRTGKLSSVEVVVDNLSLEQWRGENYDDADNPDRSQFPDTGYGSPTNFVYTTAWINSNSVVMVELAPMRTISLDDDATAVPSGIRSPLMDGLDGRGLGLGMFSFTYRNADSRARLLVQIATNDVSTSDLADLTKKSVLGWETVQEFDFSELSEDERAGGTLSSYVGLHGVKGVMRVIVDPEVVAAAHDRTINRLNEAEYGRVYLTAVAATDNPELDNGSWWGWNLRTTDEESRCLLKDGALNNPDPDAHGLAFALNNSVTADTIADNEYTKHMPFLQTPIFAKGVVGEIVFKARKYDAGDVAPTVAIYGTQSLDPDVSDAEFEYLDEIVIDCDRYETFTYQAPISKTYTAFRLAITGVAGVEAGHDGPQPKSGRVRRVLIDEVSVFEAIRARLGFRNVGAFRSRLADTDVIDDFPNKAEQPLCDEQWGVQVELYAAQLADKIDLKTKGREPRVFFHWFQGEDPWGYGKWGSNSAAKSGELIRATGSDSLVYRSSHQGASGAIVDQVSEPGTVFQYSLEVVYYMVDQEDPLTNVLSSADWVKPLWYEPIDLNENHASSGFSAYTILDTVSPGWAWFNEINLFGSYDEYWQNSDSDYQYLEIAAPSEADLTDWSVRMLVPETGSLTVKTNIVATFGMDGLAGTKRDLLGMASGMVFRVIASDPTFQGKKISSKDGTLDGTWYFPNPDGSILRASGEVAEDQPFGIQLVRPSGIVEHEIVVMGTNFWGSSSRYADQYDPSNTVTYLNKYMKGAHFFFNGYDDGGETRAVSVYDSRGEASNYWDKAMIHTPGRINTYADGTPQILSSTHPTPYGGSIFVYANIGSDHIRQTCADAVDTTASQILIIQRGSQIGTDITYRVDRWYGLGEVTTNGASMGSFAPTALHTYRVTVGKGASNNVTVVASAGICDDLRRAIGENNRYESAIMDWFEKGVDMDGNPWPEGDDDTFYLASNLTYACGNTYAELMDLTSMYWLDMCPVLSNQYLVAGYSELPHDVIRSEDLSKTNVQMSIYMAISNGMHATPSMPMESPYVIRGVEPGSSSWSYATNSAAWGAYGWSNATFKVSGLLVNGLTRFSNPTNWVPLRVFVFDRNSFYQPGNVEGKTPFTTEIEVVDPYSPESWGYRSGWGDWLKKHKKGKSDCPVLYRWYLNEFMPPVGVEVLKPNNYYDP